MCFTGYRQWCRLRGCLNQSFSHQSLPVILLGEVRWLNDIVVLYSILILILHVSECNARLHDDGAVVKCCTAGTVRWGVIWGLLAIQSAGFPLSLYGWFLLLSATLPSHQICLSVRSALWDLCFLSASRKSCLLLGLPGNNPHFPPREL